MFVLSEFRLTECGYILPNLESFSGKNESDKEILCIQCKVNKIEQSEIWLKLMGIVDKFHSLLRIVRFLAENA